MKPKTQRGNCIRGLSWAKMVKKRRGRAVIVTPGPVGGCGYSTTEVLALVAPSSAVPLRAGLVSGASAEPVAKLIAASIDTKLD